MRGGVDELQIALDVVLPRKSNNVFLINSSTPSTHALLSSPIADCGASSSFFSQADAYLVSQRRLDTTVMIKFPNNTTATSIESGLYQPAQEVVPIPATIFRSCDINRSLVGLSDLCHHGQEVRLSEHGLELSKDGVV